MTKKISSSAIFVIIVIILVGAFIVVMYSKVDTAIIGTTSTSTNYVMNTATPSVTSENYINERGGFSLKYLTLFDFVEGDVTPTTSWSYDATTTGQLLVLFKLPGEFQPNTNFSDAFFSVGKNSNKDGVASCMQLASNPAEKGEEVTINDITYTKFNYTDAGAGNRYNTTIYRTIHDNSCYSIDTVVHYGVIENYDPDMGITQFDIIKINVLFKDMVQSFKFI